MKAYILKKVAGWIAKWGGAENFDSDAVIAQIESAEQRGGTGSMKQMFVQGFINRAWPTIKVWAINAVIELLLAYAIRKGLVNKD